MATTVGAVNWPPEPGVRGPRDTPTPRGPRFPPHHRRAVPLVDVVRAEVLVYRARGPKKVVGHHQNVPPGLHGRPLLAPAARQPVYTVPRYVRVRPAAWLAPTTTGRRVWLPFGRGPRARGRRSGASPDSTPPTRQTAGRTETVACPCHIRRSWSRRPDAPPP